MDNYSMNDYSLNDITLVDKKYYSELKRKAKAWEQFKNDYHTEITQAIDNLFKLNNMDIAGETIFSLEKILNDMTEDKQYD